MKCAGIVAVLMVTTWASTDALAASARQRTLDSVLRMTPNTASGQKLYQACAACHGADGAGNASGAVPAIAGQHFSTLAKQIVDFQYDARRDLRMQHVVSEAELAFPQSIADVAGYISEMPPVAAAQAAQPDRGMHGAALYAARCARCHGARAEGRARPKVPKLAGQSATYLNRELEISGSRVRPSMLIDHEDALRGLNDEDIKQLVAAIAELRP